MKKLEKYLPLGLLNEIRGKGDLNEIRLKRNCRAVIRADNQTQILNYYIDSQTFDSITDKLLEHSYHSKLSEILMGYISLGEGYRCGVSGQAVAENGKLTNLSEINSVSIRIPRLIRGVCEPLVRYLRRCDYSKGIVIYSQPGEGKTTLIRDLALRLSDSPIYRRVALIDTRKEIYLPSMQRYSLLDVYSGYPKAVGIENAIRSMSPEIIICDEIGNSEETGAILQSIGSGVTFVVTAHGSDFKEILRRENIARLYNCGVFGAFFGIRRNGNGYDFEQNEV